MPTLPSSTEQTEDMEGRVWTFAPSEDLPQMILWQLMSQDGLISGVWWDEMMGLLGMKFTLGITQTQAKRMVELLEHWLENETQLCPASGPLDVVPAAKTPL